LVYLPPLEGGDLKAGKIPLPPWQRGILMWFGKNAQRKSLRCKLFYAPLIIVLSVIKSENGHGHVIERR
jgi:hypothetical protein